MNYIDYFVFLSFATFALLLICMLSIIKLRVRLSSAEIKLDIVMKLFEDTKKLNDLNTDGIKTIFDFLDEFTKSEHSFEESEEKHSVNKKIKKKSYN